MKFLVGSSYFFSCYPDFHSGDKDEVEFEEEPKLYKYFMQFRKTDKTRCYFKWRKMSPEEFIDYSLNISQTPMEVGKFLVPEVCEHLGLTLDHLKQLEPVFDKMDKKHLYEKVIYDSYKENNCFMLTDEQRLRAYETYKETRG